MMRWIVGSSLKLRPVIVVAAALLLIFGFDQVDDMPVDILPEFSRPYVEVQTEALGLSAAEVEALLTTPIEADLLNGVSWVEEIRSQSLPGLSSVVLVFEKGTDIMRARQMVQERLIAVHALPNVSRPPAMLNPLSSTNRAMEIGLTSRELSLIEMSVLARWTIVPRLMGLPGVANVSIYGQRKRQLQVLVEPERLRDENVTLLQIIKSAGNALWVSPLTFLEASSPGTGGWIDTPNQRLGVRHLLPITKADDLAQVAIEGAPNRRLGDVAKVVENHQPLIGDALVQDAPALILMVEKFPWANTADVTEEVEMALAAMRPGLSGLQMDSTLFRPATYLELALENLTVALLIGLGLLVIALLAYNWRTGVVSIAAVLVSASAAVSILYAQGVTLNMMIIAGFVIAFAAIIDDAIADMRSVARRLAEESDASLGRTVLEATLQMRRPMLYATLIIMLAVVPALLLEGVSGAFFTPIVTAYLLALTVSFVIALTLTPALSVLLLRKEAAQSDSPVAGALKGIHGALFGWSANAPRPAFIAVCAGLIVVLASVPFLHQDALLPEFKETDLLVRWEGSPVASHQAMSRIAGRASAELRSVRGVRNVSAHIGRAVMSDSRASINSGELWISVDPTADYQETVARVREVVDGYPGLSPDVLTFLQARVREELSGTDESLVVRVYGEEVDKLAALAEDVRRMLASVSGVQDAAVLTQPVSPTLEIEVDMQRANRYGLKPGDVRRSATSLVSGLEVGNLFEGQKVFDVVVYGAPETRHSVSAIRELLIDTPDGGHVRLEDVADVRITPANTVIHRDAVARRIDVTADVSDRDLAAVAADIEAGIRTLSFPLEYRAELLGEFAERRAAQGRLTAFAVAAAVAIYLLLQVFFGSWRLAAVIFVTLPAAVLGSVVVLLAGGGSVSLGSLLGMVLVLGLAVRHSLALVDRYRHLAHDEGQAFGAEMVRRATHEQAGPILLAAIGTALVLLPAVVMGDVAGLEILSPLGAVVLGGLVTTSLYTLLGVPAAYLLFGPVGEEESAEHALAESTEQGIDEIGART